MTTQPTSNQDPVSAQIQVFLDAFKAGDVDRFTSLFTDDTVVMPPNDTTLYGKAEVRAWHEDYRQYFRVVLISFPERDIAVTGDWAVERSSYTVSIAPAAGSGRIRDDGRRLVVWKRQPDASWKIWQMLWNSIKPIGIGTNRYMARLMQKKASRR